MTFEEQVAEALRHIGLDGINNPNGEEIAPRVVAAIQASWRGHHGPDLESALAALRGSE